MTKKAKTEIDTIKVLQALHDGVGTHLETLKAEKKTKSKKTPKDKGKSDKLDPKVLLDCIMVFSQVFLGYGYHLRQHQGRNPFGESIRTTRKNLAFILDRMQYSKEEVEEALATLNSN